MSETPVSSYPLDIPNDPMRQDPSLGLDTARLNELARISAQPGVYFGKGLDLTDDDRRQFDIVATRVEDILKPAYEHPAWKAFMELVDEGSARGILMSFSPHEGTEVPTWCVDGGEDPEIKKVRRVTDGKSAPGIQVPNNIFNLYHWHNTTESLRGYASRSNETLRGTSPKPLSQALRHMAVFVKSSQQNKSNDTSN